MAETPADVLVAGYPDIDGAAKDFESLGALVRDTQVSIGGVILLTHAPDGIVAVRQPRPRGVGVGGRAGRAVGLSRRRRGRWSPSGLSRAGSSASTSATASSRTSPAILTAKESAGARAISSLTSRLRAQPSLRRCPGSCPR